MEVLRHPELRGRPVVVGGAGDPTQWRVVVSTASYEARAFGVHSGMPLRTAARRCPDAVFLPVDAPAYWAASEQVMATLRTFPVVVEVLGWDEAFLAAETDDPARLAAAIQAQVLARTGLACSIGIGGNKLQAKQATGFGQTGRYLSADRRELAGGDGRPPDHRPSGASATAPPRSSAASGSTSVAQLASADWRMLAAAFGPTIGPGLKAMGMGLGPTEVSAEPYVPRSRSHETTFPKDLTDRAAIETAVTGLARELAQDAATTGRPVVRVAVKVRYATFFTRTSAMKLRTGATTDGELIARAALDVLQRFDLSRPVRLLGVRVEYERGE